MNMPLRPAGSHAVFLLPFDQPAPSLIETSCARLKSNTSRCLWRPNTLLNHVGINEGL
jgi:hypothetical protein